jgi:hypothetical protein
MDHLQQTIGNRAVGRLLGESPGGDFGSDVQRRLGLDPAQLGAAQSRGEKIEAAVTGTTYSKIIAALKSYHQNKDPNQELQFVDVVLGLSQVWMKKYGNSKSKSDVKKRLLVEDLEAEAGAERGRLLAQAKYLEDAKTDQMDALTETGKTVALPEAANVAAGKTGRGMGERQAAVDIAQQFGLNEAELAAIKIFTASDYTYINPATANKDSWMKSQRQGTIAKGTEKFRPNAKGLKLKEELEAKNLRNLKEQGAMHAGMMMKAAAKLPPFVTTAYRGARMTMKEFHERYSPDQPTVFNAFVSSAITEEPARVFANGGGEVTPSADQTVSVMCLLSVTNGRDISALSVMGSIEKEVLLLPGSTFKVSNIEHLKEGDAGKPEATDWMVVHLDQVK